MSLQTQPSRTTHGDAAAWIRPSGVVCLVAGVLGAVSGVVLAAWPAQVPDDRWSYPLTPEGFVGIQLFFAVHHLGLLAGLVALGATTALGAGRLGRAGLGIAVAGTALLTLTEALATAMADATLDEGGWVDALYGISTTACGIGLVLAGVAIRKEGRWVGWSSYLVLTMGIWVFVPIFPALMLSFVGARLAIGSWMLLFGALGWVLFAHPE